MDANTDPTVFTDEELKRLEEDGITILQSPLNSYNIIGLVARLKAAEDFINLAADYSETVHPLVADAFRNWRKVAGKAK